MRVALTFDAEHPDRPRCAPEVPAAIADVLRAKGARATFFLQGRWVEAYPGLASRIAEDGHAIGNHSFFHARMPLLTDEGLRFDVCEAERVIAEATGVDPRPWFRGPFGAGWDDARVIEVLRGLGYRHVGWDVVVHDWEPDRTPEAIERAAVDGTLSRDGEVVLLLHAWPEQTLEALPSILDRLSVGGAELVGIDQLSDISRGALL